MSVSGAVEFVMRLLALGFSFGFSVKLAKINIGSSLVYNVMQRQYFHSE